MEFAQIVLVLWKIAVDVMKWMESLTGVDDIREILTEFDKPVVATRFTLSMSSHAFAKCI